MMIKKIQQTKYESNGNVFDTFEEAAFDDLNYKIRSNMQQYENYCKIIAKVIRDYPDTLTKLMKDYQKQLEKGF